MLRRSSALALLLLAASCSSSSDTTSSSGSSSGTTPNDGSIVGDIRESVTWEDGTKLGGVIRIVEGVQVTIAPGAKITCNEATRILLGGTLKVSSKDKHASISCSKWTGITVAKNGKLDIDGLDIENAQSAFETTPEAGECVVKNTNIKTCVRPFTVGAKSKLLLDHVDASVPAAVGNFDKSYVEVYGVLEAHYLKYDAQTNEGLMARDGGEITLTDCELIAHNGQDLVSSYEGKSINVSYTTMTGAHCGPHMQGVETATFDHITSTGNLFGITIYKGNSVTVTNSNLGGGIAWLDLQGDHGAVSLENIYLQPTATGTEPTSKVVNTDPPVKDTRVTEPIADAKPR